MLTLFFALVLLIHFIPLSTGRFDRLEGPRSKGAAIKKSQSSAPRKTVQGTTTTVQASTQK